MGQNPALISELLRLTLVISRDDAAPRTVQQLAEAAFVGGVTALQLREKKLPGGDFYRLALSLTQFCRLKNKPLIINDRLDIALAVEADGLHLGQEDLPLTVARKLWPRPKILGATVKTLEQAQKALDQGADYLGVGALFPSPSKVTAPVIDIKTVREIQTVCLPMVGIGGLTVERAKAAWSLGFDGLAVISAVAGAKDPAQAAAAILAQRPA